MREQAGNNYRGIPQECRAQLHALHMSCCPTVWFLEESFAQPLAKPNDIPSSLLDFPSASCPFPPRSKPSSTQPIHPISILLVHDKTTLISCDQEHRKWPLQCPRYPHRAPWMDCIYQVCTTTVTLGSGLPGSRINQSPPEGPTNLSVPTLNIVPTPHSSTLTRIKQMLVDSSVL